MIKGNKVEINGNKVDMCCAANCPATHYALRTTQYFLLLFLLFALSACTTDITVDLPDPVDAIVVEGFIEIGEAPRILLTRNAAFFGQFDLNDIDIYQVHNAIVTVSYIELGDTIKEVLEEECISIQIDSTRTVNVCYYMAINPQIIGKENTIYNLEIVTEGDTFIAKTKIPGLYHLDSLYITPHINPDIDSLVTLNARFTDPDTLGNYIRYFTKRNSEQFWPVSVSDDRLFNGQQYGGPLRRGSDPEAEFDVNTFFYFWRGDTAIVKWSQIDKAHYDFWSSLAFEGSSGGPFSSATIIKTNIERKNDNGQRVGLGIWGGYASTYDTIYIPSTP